MDVYLQLISLPVESGRGGLEWTGCFESFSFDFGNNNGNNCRSDFYLKEVEDVVPCYRGVLNSCVPGHD